MNRAPVRVHRDATTPWVRIGDVHTHPENQSEPFLNSSYRVHEIGSDSSPQLMEADYDPGVKIEVHAHDHDEIVYVVKGQMIVGNSSLGPGSSVFVAANTLYSFRAGASGLRFLNVRPVRDDTHIEAEDFLARRAASKTRDIE